MPTNSSKPYLDSLHLGVQGLGEVLESITDAFFALDHEWRFTYINNAAERLLDRKRSDLLGQKIWTEFPQAVGTRFEQQYRQAIDEQVTVEFEDYYPPLKSWLSVRAYPTPSGLFVYFQNFNERHAVQEALRASEERAREAAERLSFVLVSAELGDWEWDSQTDLIKLSPRAAQIYGVPVEPIQTRTKLRQLLDPADRERARLAVDEPQSPDGHYQIEYRVNRSDGKQVWVFAHGRGRFDASGKMIGAAGIVQDITSRKNAQVATRELAEKLEQQNRLFEQIASTTPDFIYVFDLQGRFIYANKRLLDVWGLSFEQAVGKNLYELNYPKWHADMHMRELAQVIETRKPIKGEVPFTGGSGIFGVYEYIFTPVLDARGNVDVVTGTTRDVTARHHSERDAKEIKVNLENSLARWQAIVDNMAEGVVLVDARANILDMNRAALAMHGYTSVEEVRRPLAQIAPIFEIRARDGTLIPFEQWPVPRLLRGETFSNMEVRLKRSDQQGERVVSYSGTVIRDHQGKITLVLLTLHDLTEERRAQQTLRESEVRFREIFEQTPIGLTLNEIGGRYLHVNPAYCRIVGYSREELLSSTMDFRDLIYPDDRPTVLERHAATIRGDIPAFYLEKRYVRRDGTTVWVRVTGTVRRDPEGKPIQFVRLVEDIDDRKRAEAEVRQLLESERSARTEAERASRMKDEFLATLSHELRTPLNAILGWAQLLSTGPRDDADFEEGIRTIERSARAQTQIIEDLLDMSRIISGKIRLDVQRIDIAPAVQAAVEAVRLAADAKGVRLQVVLDSSGGTISGDPTRLQQVFWNLLSNAVKFTPKDGRVQVLLEKVHSHLEVSVIDTGEGISPEFLPHVFDRFRQADASTTRRHGGLGLGLAIVKQLVELHGGSVSTKSAGPGKGATFTVSLPVTPMQPDAEPVPERRHPKAPRAALDVCDRIAGVSAVVVDDEADSRGLLKRFLEDCDVRVFPAASASEALKLVQEKRPDVLISDVGMPGEDGYWLIRQVRSLPADKGRGTPAVALTAYARAEDRVSAILAGFQYHVTKPVEPAELIAIIASLTQR